MESPTGKLGLLPLPEGERNSAECAAPLWFELPNVLAQSTLDPQRLREQMAVAVPLGKNLQADRHAVSTFE
jgi:hypothetical protein